MASEELFEPIGAAVETTEMGTMQTESMCPQCEQNGITKLMLVSIPFFKEIILASFECNNEDCLYKNSTVQFGGKMQPFGCVYSLLVKEPNDLNRQIVKSEYCSISIPELDFEIPPRQGDITTVEGVLTAVINGLQQEQPVRKVMAPSLYLQIEAFIAKIQRCVDLAEPFTLQLRDPSGNSHVQNFHAPHPDPELTITRFKRSNEDNIALGLAVADQFNEDANKLPMPAADYNSRRTKEEEGMVDDGKISLGYSMAEQCYACKKDGYVNMAMIDIPHFKETVIMSFKCDHCGFTSNEIKSGGAVPDLGTKITLKVQNEVDLSRDVLKSHTCTVTVPELDFEMAEGSLGAMFTTVEGLLSQMHAELLEVHKTGFSLGDSATTAERNEFQRVLKELETLREGKKPFTLILVDPLSHSYLQSVSDDPAEDPQLVIEKFERTPEMNEELGIDFLIQQEKEEKERQQQQSTEAGGDGATAQDQSASSSS